MLARQAVLTEPYKVEIREVDLPDPAPNQILIETHASAISAGSIPLFDGFFGTMGVSDFSPASMAGLRSLTFPAPSDHPASDTDEILLLPCK